ncbi:SpoU rRNA methylase family protein [Arcticibacter tournemirensis]|uniref:RNA methyltransferase n=1 Tax=Arcticibacter tournemirensis TaxID=699437 RepID=A0A5M9H4E4_9SPHI|nr:RNA methyltransferase [Arcticibacter tournemirensis]KAA8481802.1 RNA methyltransferase [Arcticibacter tournemirensis]TQM50163.1 SpoU rRNA methylase family protein [Arcticibacter tournemirensis]
MDTREDTTGENVRKLKLDELNRASVEAFKQQKKLPVTVVLDNVRSMHNVGSIFRTCDGFAVEQIFLCGITGQPPHREIEKTALGATQSIDWKYFTEISEAIGELKSSGYKIVAIEQALNSVMLNDFQPLNGLKYALIFGNEVNGVSDEAMKEIDTCIEIPQFGTKHSFNIVVSAGIVLWDFFAKAGCRL